MRLNNEEIQKLCETLGTDRLNSWSRVNCVHNSLYEYLLKYILHKPEDRDDSIYKITGGISHNILEKFYSGEIKYEDMIDEFEDGWMAAFEIAGLKFNRSDSERNKSIADKYYYDFERCRDYDLDDYLMSFADMIAVSGVYDDEKNTVPDDWSSEEQQTYE